MRGRIRWKEIHNGSHSSGRDYSILGVKISSGKKGVWRGNVHKKNGLKMVPMEIKGSDNDDLTGTFTGIHR